jgi:hypothetical protein
MCTRKEEQEEFAAFSEQTFVSLDSVRASRPPSKSVESVVSVARFKREIKSKKRMRDERKRESTCIRK